MVSSRLVDFPDDETDASLPEMMFADGEEPVGVRVITYQSSRAINIILNPLEDEEIQYLRKSPFGKFVEIAEKPAFSGRFARFLLSRQLKVRKKHEAWFRFAGNPIRFSLREFAIVTGLPCGQYPQKSSTKKKKTINEKPYWPELFGSVEDMRVSKAVKMLRKKTVSDRVIRLKLACLAIVSSVLLSTNMKQKMLKEHAELLVDIEEFFAFPWGRLAFDLLMKSIKQRDEISLSQNTIALKGFALALQLVIVEACPALTEVVQESCSSSDSDSEEDDGDSLSRKTKKQTLSPAHAREVDRKAEALVRCIIPQDPERPIDEFSMVWEDEVNDIKVENLVMLICANQRFTKDMFKGGATAADVAKMREKGSVRGKNQHPRENQRDPISTKNDYNKLKELVVAILKPELERIDGQLASVTASVKEVSSSTDASKSSVVASVDAMLATFRTEMISYIGRNTSTPAVPEKQPIPTNEVERNSECNNRSEGVGNTEAEGRDQNDAIIENVLENLSHYSTPPRSSDQQLGYEAQSRLKEKVLIYGPSGDKGPSNGHASHMSAGEVPAEQKEAGEKKSHNSSPHASVNLVSHGGTFSNNSASGQSATPKEKEEEYPSFSLGLTQERGSDPTPVVPEIAPNALVLVPATQRTEGDEKEETLLSRKSKRLRTVPSQLFSDYHCSTTISNRLPEFHLMGSSSYESSVIDEKYKRLKILLKDESFINVGGLNVYGKDIKEIGDRKRLLPGRVVDILSRLLTSTFDNHEGQRIGSRPAFFDSKMWSMLIRNFPKFKKFKLKHSYVFPPGLVECFKATVKCEDSLPRFYLPISVDKKYWIGVCVDFSTQMVEVLDCNRCERSDSSLAKYLHPVTEMFPHLVHRCAMLSEIPSTPMTLERIKCVPQNTNPADSGITASLLIQIHALFGVPGCTRITPEFIADASQRAAVMIYECHQML